MRLEKHALSHRVREINLAAVKIARDVASPSPVVDPTTPSRIDEFTDWRSGETRTLTGYVEQNIAGLKAAAFPELEPVVAGPAPSAVAVREEPAVQSAAPPATSQKYVTGEVVSLRKVVVASEDIGEEDEPELIETPELTLAPEPAPLALTAEREAELLANASI